MLRCEGYQVNGFHFCGIVKNEILNLEPLINTDNYFELIKYLDSVANLFDNECNVASKITNVIYKLYQLEYLDEKFYESLGYFYNMHRRCGMVLYLKINGE